MLSAATTQIGMLARLGTGHSQRTEQQALRQAVEAGNRRLVKDLLAGRPALAQAIDDEGESPLHWAVHAAAREPTEDRSVIVACLLEADADCMARNRRGLTPLDLAAQAPYDPALLHTLRNGGRRRAPQAGAAEAAMEPGARGTDRVDDDWRPPRAGRAVRQGLLALTASLGRRDPDAPPEPRASVRALLQSLAALYRDADADSAKHCLSTLRMLLQRYPSLDEAHRDDMVHLYEALVRVWMRGSHWQEGFCYGHHARRLLLADGHVTDRLAPMIDRLEAAMVREHLSQWAPRAQVQLRAALFDLATQCAAMDAPLPMLERAHRLFAALARSHALLASHGLTPGTDEDPREAVPSRQLTVAIIALLDRLRRTARGAIDFVDVAQRVLLLAEAAGAIGQHACGAAWCDSVVRQIEQEECVASLKRYDCTAHRRMAQSLRSRIGVACVPAAAPPPLWRTLRSSLDGLREQAAAQMAPLGLPDATDRAALDDWDTPLPIEDVQERLTARYKTLIGQIARACRQWMLTEPPCAFAIVGLGSMSRGDMSPYSDFEYALLLDAPAPADSLAHGWFASFGRLFDLAICSLGESAPGPDHPLPVPAGFEVDPGVRVAASARAWTGTPEQLADALRQRSIANANDHLDADQGLHFSLMTPCLAHGEPALMRRLMTALARSLDAPLDGDDPGRLRAREDLALRQLHADLRRFAGAGARRSATGGDLKHDYRGPLVHTLTALSLLYGHNDMPPRAALANLAKGKRFSAPFLADWRWAMATVQTVRYRLQLRERGRHEQCHALTRQEREHLQAVQDRVVRPLCTALSQLVGVGLPLSPGSGTAQALRRLDDADPALFPLADGPVPGPLPLEGTRSLAATLAIRRAPLEEMGKHYAAERATAPLGQAMQRWAAWRDALRAVPGNEGRLRALAVLPWPDGWRGRWAQTQAAFHRRLGSWLVDADPAGADAIQVRVATPAGVVAFGLTPAIARQLFDAHGDPLPKPAGQPGTHRVLPVRFEAGRRKRVWWVKFDPEAPGSVPLLHALDRRLTGGRGMAASLAFQMRSGARVFDAQVTEGIAGRSLAQLLREEPAALRALDAASFTRALLLELVVGPAEDKADDYFVVEDGGPPMLERIGSARAALGALGLVLRGQPDLPVRSHLLCLDQMTRELDLKVLDEVGGLQADALLEAWLQDAGQGGSSGLNGIAAAGDMTALRQRLETVIGMAALAARLGVAPTGIMWLRSLQPELAGPYLAAFERYPVRASDAGAPAQRFAFLDAGLAIADGQGRYAGADAATHAARFGLTALYRRPRARPWPGGDAAAPAPGGAMPAAGAPGRDLAAIVQAVLSGSEGAARSFAALPAPQRTAVFDTVATALHHNAGAIAPAEQRRLLAALAGTAFVCLDLSPFAAALTDSLLEALLRGAGPSLRRLDLSGCTQLTPQALRQVEAHAVGLRSLTLRAMRFRGVRLPGDPTLPERAAAPLVGIHGPPQPASLHWPLLDELDLCGNDTLRMVRVEAPALRVLRIDGCTALQDLQLDGVRQLSRLEARQCAALSEPVLQKLARDNPALVDVRLTDCLQLRHVALRETYPWLLAWPWNAWTDEGVAWLHHALSKADGTAYRPMPGHAVQQIVDWLHYRERAIDALVRVYHDAGTPQRLRDAVRAALMLRERLAPVATAQAAATLVGDASDSQPAVGMAMLVPSLLSASSEAARIAAAAALGNLIAIPSRDMVARWAQR